MAHDLVYDLCRRAKLEDKPLLELLSESEEVKKAGLSNGELAKLCDPANYLGLSEVMVDRVLEGARRLNLGYGRNAHLSDSIESKNSRALL